MQNQSVMGDLKYSGDGYVLTPVDKANGNVSLIWKKYAPTFFEHCKNIDHGNLLKNTFNDLFIYFGTSASEDNNAYHQLVGFLSYIKIEPKVYLLL